MGLPLKLPGACVAPKTRGSSASQMGDGGSPRVTHGEGVQGRAGAEPLGPVAEGCMSGSMWMWDAKVKGQVPGWEERQWAAGDPLGVKALRA